MSWNSAYKLHLIPWPQIWTRSYVQYKIVMTSWWRNIWKISETISFVSSNPHSYWFSVTNYFLFSRYFNCSILFHNLCKKKQNCLKIAEKWRHICQKRYHFVDNVIRTRDMFIILDPTSLFQSILVLNVSAKFEYDWIKDEEVAPIS